MKIIRCNWCQDELPTNEGFLTVGIKSAEPDLVPNPVTSTAHICGHCAPDFCKKMGIALIKPGAQKPAKLHTITPEKLNVSKVTKD